MRIVMQNGKIVPLMRPFDYQPSIDEIAYSLAGRFRWGGQTRMTVAQHSILVADLLPPNLKFSGLMHDAHEAYTSDVATPQKELFRHSSDFYDRYEYEWAARVRKFFQLPVELHPDVKEADRKAASIEIAVLFPQETITSFIELGVNPDYSRDFDVLSPDEARVRFLERVTAYSQFG